MTTDPERTDRTPPATADVVRAAGWVVTRWAPRAPLRVLEVLPWHGSSVGYLVHVETTAVPILDGANVRPSRPKVNR